MIGTRKAHPILKQIRRDGSVFLRERKTWAECERRLSWLDSPPSARLDSVHAKDTGMKELTFIDLFCGCGGFSLGMDRAGFRFLAAVDNSPEAATVCVTNFPDVPHVLEKDLEKFPPKPLSCSRLCRM